MERATAIKKLTKLLGKSVAYQIDPKAPSREERDEAHAELPAANAKSASLLKQLEARRSAILEADAEYRRLTVDYKEAKERNRRLLSITHKYKITVGVSNSLFFKVHAQGDSWEQVIEKLTKR